MHEEAAAVHSEGEHPEEEALAEAHPEAVQEAVLSDEGHQEAVVVLVEALPEEEEVASVVVAEVEASKMYHMYDEARSCIHAAFRFGFKEYPAATGTARRHPHPGKTIQMTESLEAKNTTTFCHHNTSIVEASIWWHLEEAADGYNSVQVNTQTYLRDWRLATKQRRII